MKKWKSILALLLVVALCAALLAACAAKEQPENSVEPSGTDAQDTPSTPDDQNQAGASSDDQNQPADEDEEEDVVQIEFYLATVNTIESDAAESIEEAIDAITIPAIGVDVNLHCTSFGDYPTAVTVAIAGGEVIDLCSVFARVPADFATMYANGQLTDMTPYLEQYGQDIKEICGTYLNAGMVNGKVYAIPTFRNYATTAYHIMRKDILEDLGLVEFAQNMSSFSELEQIFQAVQDANYDGLYAVGGNQSVMWNRITCTPWVGDSFSDYEPYDTIGDGQYVLAVWEDGVVTNVFESEGFLNVVKKVADWYEKGWVWPDSHLAGEHPDIVMKNGVIFSCQQESELGVESAKRQSTGYDVVCVPMGDQMVSTASVIKFACGMPVTAAEPAAAMKFLNLLYSSEELMNLLDWGLEGRDYVMNDVGEAVYPNDEANVPYHVSDFIFGNFFLVKPWLDQGADFRDKAYAANSSAPVSPFLGFSFDTSELANEIAAINSVKDEYYYQITCGHYTDETYQTFMNKLDTAGIDTYIAAAQEQLDAWRAAKN